MKSLNFKCGQANRQIQLQTLPSSIQKVNIRRQHINFNLNQKFSCKNSISQSGIILDHRQQNQSESEIQFQNVLKQRESEYFGLSTQQIQAIGLCGPQASNESKVLEDKLTASCYYGGSTPVSEYTRMPAMMAGRRHAAGFRSKSRPPDLPSLLLDSRIVYIAMPLVPAVAELLMSEFLWLNYYKRDKPLYVYINSIGSLSPDGQPIASDNEALTVLDMMDYVKCPVYTLAIGQTLGNATMILAAGNKGKRTSLPNSRIQTSPPKMNRSFGSVQNIMIKANEIEGANKIYMRKMAQFTGKTVDQIDKDMQRPRYFNPKMAVEYGIIDRVVESTKKSENMAQAVDYDRIAKIAAQQKQAARGGEMEAAAGY